ncbi:ABC transporter permease, partial [Escherichia coli]|nr:ABC transporter permease [Escherichia coli]
PFASQLKKVTGIENEDVLFNVLRSDFGVKEKNSVIIESSNYDLAKKEYVYINDLPFKVNSVTSKKKTVFLDSLGLNSLQEDGELFIPLKTATRLLLNNEIDSARVVLKKEVDDINLMQLNTLLKSNGVDNYKIISFIDAKRAVDNVLNRFSLLTNIMYFFLTVTSIIISKSMSKKMFQCRSTEFALKMLNGINGKTICIVIFVESSIVALLSIFVSLLISFVILVVVSRAISVELAMRYHALMTSVCVIAFF